MRGTFANIRIKNQLVPGVEGGVTAHLPGGEVMAIYDAAMQYQAEGVPLVVLAGKEYGSGSSRDWAAKGTMLLGVKAVIAESYERIHRSNLVDMGVLPLQFADGESAAVARPHAAASATTSRAPAHHWRRAGGSRSWPPPTTARRDGSRRCAASTRRKSSTAYRHGGILPYVLRQLVSRAS